MHPIPTPAFLRTIVAAILVGLAATAVAQSTRPLEVAAPHETILAIGATPQAWPDGDLHDALSELGWERAEEAWAALVATAEEIGGDLGRGPGPFGMAGELAEELPDLERLRADLAEACPALDEDLEALGDRPWVDEVLVTVSADAFAPFPAGLLAIRTAPDATDAVDAVHDRLVGCFAAEEPAGEQDGTELHVLGDGSDMPLVLARRDDLTLVGTRPDVVRGALRRLGGAEEPSFATSPIGAAVAEMDGGFRLALHAAALADVAESSLPTFGDETAALARDRAVAALRTLGGAALRLAVEEDGLVAESVVAHDPAGGDEELAEILACEGCGVSAPELVPADAYAAQGSVLRPEAWFDWIDGHVRALSESAGEATDLRTLLREEAGVDVDRALFDWIGDEYRAVRLEPFSTDLRDLVVQPPMGFVMPVESTEAAEAGLAAIAEAAVALYETFAASDPDFPDDLAALASVRDAEADGVPYRRVRIGPGDEFGVGLVGDRLVVASPASAFGAFVAVENGDVPGATDAEGWRRTADAAEGGELVGWSYGAGGGDLLGVADLVDVLAQPVAFAAATGLDAALEEARNAGADAGPPSDDPIADPFDDDPFGRAAGTTVDLSTAAPYETFDLEGATIETLEVPGTTSGALDADAPDVGGDAMVLYRLEGATAGTTYTIEMTSDPIDTYLYLIDGATGGVLGSNDDAPSTRRSAITVTADGETDLVVGASAFGGFGSGPFELRVSEGAADADAGASERPRNVADLQGYGSADLGDAEPRALTVPAAVSAELTEEAATVLGKRADLYRLEGLAAGDVVTVAMTSDPIDTYLYLIDAEGERLLAENDDAPSVDRSELRFTADGERALLVAATSWGGNDAGPYELAVEVEPAASDDADAGTPTDDAGENDAAAGGAVGSDGATAGDGTSSEAADPTSEDAVDGAATDAEGGVAGGTGNDALEEDAVEAPTFDDLLALTDVVEGTIREIGERVGPSTSVTVVEDGVWRTIARQAFDW